MMKFKVKRVDPKKAASFAGIWFGSFSLILVPFFFIASVFSPKDSAGWFDLIFILIPFIYAIMGFAMTYVTCVIYNFIARKIVSIEIELEQIEIEQIP